MANFLSIEGLTYTLKKLKPIIDGKASGSHNHNIEDLNNYGKRIYDATTSRSANTFLAAPNGSNGVGTFRKIVEADLPTELENHVIPYYKAFDAGGGDGSKLYLKIITIDLTGSQYLNQPMIFIFGHRGGNAMTRLTVLFEHSTTPDSAKVSTFGIAGASMDFYIVKEAAGKFAIYVKKAESYDNIALYGYYKGSYMVGAKVAFVDTAVASVPAGYATATWNENVGYASKAGNVDWSNVSNHPTTISGYGITDAAPKSHGHNYAGSTSDGGAAKSVASSIKIQLNGGTTEGNNQFTFNGSAAKTVNITPSSIGALPSGGTATKASEADKLSTSAGSGTQPIYFSNGKPTNCSYTLAKSVPADAVFTDTKYSTGNASTSGLTKLYTSTGNNTDGTMTQKAIKEALAGTTSSEHTHTSINVKGTNTVSTKANDTTGTWGGEGISGHFYSKANLITDQPSDYGYLFNIGNDSEVHQLWMEQSSGKMCHRGGNVSGWNGTWKTLLDSSNFTDYVWGNSTNKVKFYQKDVPDGNSKKWVCLGIVKIATFGRTAVIDFWTGKGFNGSSSQNSHLNITIKKAWQASASTTSACGVMVRCYNCTDVDVKVVATAHDTYKVYMYNPWEYPSGPMEIHGDYTSFTESTEILSSAPTGALQDVTIFRDDDALMLNKNKLLTGKNFTGNINIESSEGTDLGITVTNTTESTGKKGVALRIGSTKTNRGLYDTSGNKWMIYSDDKNDITMNGHLANSLKIKYDSGDEILTFNGASNQTLSIPKIKTGTSLPDTSDYKDGDIFILYS